MVATANFFEAPRGCDVFQSLRGSSESDPVSKYEVSHPAAKDDYFEVARGCSDTHPVAKDECSHPVGKDNLN